MYHHLHDVRAALRTRWRKMLTLASSLMSAHGALTRAHANSDGRLRDSTHAPTWQHMGCSLHHRRHLRHCDRGLRPRSRCHYQHDPHPLVSGAGCCAHLPDGRVVYRLVSPRVRRQTLATHQRPFQQRCRRQLHLLWVDVAPSCASLHGLPRRPQFLLPRQHRLDHGLPAATSPSPFAFPSASAPSYAHDELLRLQPHQHQPASRSGCAPRCRRPRCPCRQDTAEVVAARHRRPPRQGHY
mmetsp:Transcript_25882/g.90115  ORF Transcript_25882/g.90115 Transcript_25882/m.90115 type:complete len:240 (-) Transcript_25882:981-1700(-)